MESHPSSTSDLISSLPQNVLEYILKLLPLKEAVRTSILSRQWRYAWTTLPKLDFSGVLRPGLESNIVGIMNQVLSQHTDTIVKFSLSYIIGSEIPDVQRWIQIICGKRVQELNFQLDMGVQYMVPSTLFSCDSLKLLVLSYCNLSVPSGFRAFGRLTKLFLFRVSFVEIDDLQNLLSKCPNLTVLELIRVDGTIDLNAIAPRLQTFYTVGDFGILYVRLTPHLRYVSIRVGLFDGDEKPLSQYVGGYVHHLVRAVHHRDSLKTLELGGDTIRYLLLTGAAPQERLDLVCGNLKTLQLSWHFGDRKETAAILRLIRDSPRLRELDVTACTDPFRPWPIGDYWKTVRPSDSSFNRLKKVSIECFSGTKAQLALMRYVLANSSVLRTMRFHIISLRGTSKTRRVISKLLSFRRRSELARIKWVYP